MSWKWKNAAQQCAAGIRTDPAPAIQLEREAITTRTAKTCQDYSESIKCLLTTSSSRAFILLEAERRWRTGLVPSEGEKLSPAGGVRAAATHRQETTLGFSIPFKPGTSQGVKSLGTETPGDAWHHSERGDTRFLHQPQRDSSQRQPLAEPASLVG